MPLRSDPQKKHALTLAKGFKCAAGAFGIKRSGKRDLTLIYCDVPCSAAAVMSRTSAPANPIILNRKHLKNNTAQAIVCNAGISNAITGQQGYKNAETMAKLAANALNCKPTDVLVASTGIIGVQLPMDKIETGINTLAQQLKSTPASDEAAARAIMTTDLVPKWASVQKKIGGKTITLGGIAKGSGMISPNMATMLSFITTDVDISPALMHEALTTAANADGSFNKLSIDTDTSTSDTVAILASGLAGNPTIKTKNKDYRLFAEALTELCQDLAYKIIADGEGVNTVIRVTIEGAKTDKDALAFARAVADSPLVKTAVHGHDPNWGRIAAALGKTTAPLNLDKLTISIGSATVLKDGQPVKFNAAKISKELAQSEVGITCHIGKGKARCVFLGCDLSRRYITINADYHT